MTSIAAQETLTISTGSNEDSKTTIQSDTLVLSATDVVVTNNGGEAAAMGISEIEISGNKLTLNSVNERDALIRGGDKISLRGLSECENCGHYVSGNLNSPLDEVGTNPNGGEQTEGPIDGPVWALRLSTSMAKAPLTT